MSEINYELYNEFAQVYFKQLDECKTKKDLENLIERIRNLSKWLRIAGIIICIIGLIIGLATNDDSRIVSWIVGGTFGILLIILPLCFRPVIKEAERRLSKFAFMENSIKALDDDVFIKQLMQAALNKEFEDHEVKIYKHSLVYSEAHNSDCEYPIATIACNFGNDSSVIGIRKTLIDVIKREPEVREAFQEDIAHQIKQYYYENIKFIEHESMSSLIALNFFGTETTKQKSEIKEMLLWLEQEKDHTISKMLCNRCGVEGRTLALVDLCEENKDTFIKILNERNSSSNKTNNGKDQETQETTASESPKPSNGKFTIGNIVLN